MRYAAMDRNAAKLRALARQSRVLARTHENHSNAETAYRLAELYERQATELAGIFAVETKPSATVSFVLGRNGA